MRAARQHEAVRGAVWRERTARRAWLAWGDHVAYYRRMSSLVAKAYAKSARLYKQSVFDQWCDFVEEIERRKDTLKRCVTSKRLLTSWFLDWYWTAFEGDINGALGLITGSAEDIIGNVYGDDRGGVNRGVFKEWQMLGSSLEALVDARGLGGGSRLASPLASPVARAAGAWRGGAGGGGGGGGGSPGIAAGDGGADGGDAAGGTPIRIPTTTFARRTTPRARSPRARPRSEPRGDLPRTRRTRLTEIDSIRFDSIRFDPPRGVLFGTPTGEVFSPKGGGGNRERVRARRRLARS